MSNRSDGRLMLSFEGTELPDLVSTTLEDRAVSGVTFFRPHNYRDPAQLLELSRSIDAARGDELPLLIAIDQEGGQLHAFGAPATMWPGNMALGAAGDTELSRAVGRAMGTELRAVGINVDYAPVADLATNPANPATGARSFGEDPTAVAGHVAAIVEGIQSAGVAATMKHFPGKGDSDIDSHHGMPIIRHDLTRLEAHEFAPFRAAIDAGVKMAMTGHFALPAITGSDDLPCTLAIESNTGLLRDTMGFDGVMITDALDMRALRQGAFQIIDIIAAINSGVDLLLLTADPEQEERATVGLELAVSRRLIEPRRLAEADRRVMELRRWLAGFETPSLDVVGCAEHRELAAAVARRSITVVENRAGLLPVNLSADDRILVVETQPSSLTPADTSDYEPPRVAETVRSLTDAVVEGIVIPVEPDRRYRETVRSGAAGADAVIFATAAASLFDAQAEIVRAAQSVNDRVIVVATRTPWDLEALPDTDTYVCAWSATEPSTSATIEVVLGSAKASGRLPVTVGSHPVGSGIDLP